MGTAQAQGARPSCWPTCAAGRAIATFSRVRDACLTSQTLRVHAATRLPAECPSPPRRLPQPAVRETVISPAASPLNPALSAILRRCITGEQLMLGAATVGLGNRAKEEQNAASAAMGNAVLLHVGKLSKHLV